MNRRPALIFLSAFVCLALSFAISSYSAEEPQAVPVEPGLERTAVVEEPTTPAPPDEGTNEEEGLPDWIELERDSRVPAVLFCEDVGFRTPCSECPPTCLLEGDEVPCECTTHRFGSICFCPA